MSKAINTTNGLDIISPLWPAPNNIVAGSTTRLLAQAGRDFDLSDKAPIYSGNSSNTPDRQLLLQALESAHSVQWLDQVHGNRVITVNDPELTNSNPIAERQELPKADALVTGGIGQVCAVVTADCLPILLCDAGGKFVAAVHAGWRSLLTGVIANTADAMRRALSPHTEASRTGSSGKDTVTPIYAWLGPAIGPDHFEVGSEVRDAFLDAWAGRLADTEIVSRAFKPEKDRYMADIYQLGNIALQAVGISHVYGGGWCTYCEPRRFYSHRRGADQGRMASFIYINK